jgi:short-subunit dehydrogenase
MPRHSFWQDKRVFITGASSGIGWATAQYLSQRGARLGLLARREDRLAALGAQLQSQGGVAEYCLADVTDAGATAAAVRELESRLGPCDVLIAVAGVYRHTNVKKFDAAHVNEVLGVNTSGVVNAFGAVLPGMVERRSGRVAAVASMAAMLGLPGAGAYSASKAAVVTLLESLRVDLHPYGIKVTVACPGFVDTPMITDEERKTLRGLLSAEQAAKRIAWAIERGRAEHWFPWHTWLMCRAARMLPPHLFRLVMANYPEMEEVPSPSPSGRGPG